MCETGGERDDEEEEDEGGDKEEFVQHGCLRVQSSKYTMRKKKCGKRTRQEF